MNPWSGAAAINLPTEAQMSKRPQNNPIKAEFNRLEAASTPWWAHGFSVFGRCVELAILPFRMAVLAAEAIVAFTFAGLVVAGYLWYKGVIPDAAVTELLAGLGNRLISIIENSGLI
jgi:hypothetical protein